MGRRAATGLHLALVLLGALLYVVFVLPRWWVLTGSVPSTLATVGRIAAGLPIAAASIPVWLTLQRSLRPSAQTPELALRLRAWSAVLHVVAGVLILLAALTELLVSLDTAGPYLFGVYGAAAAIAILAVAAFYLSFVAEKPPAEPKPAKEPKAKKEKKPKKKRGHKADESATPEDADDDTESESASDIDTDDSEESAETTETVAEAGEPEPKPAAGGLRNKRKRRADR